MPSALAIGEPQVCDRSSLDASSLPIPINGLSMNVIDSHARGERAIRRPNHEKKVTKTAPNPDSELNRSDGKKKSKAHKATKWAKKMK